MSYTIDHWDTGYGLRKLVHDPKNLIDHPRTKNTKDERHLYASPYMPREALVEALESYPAFQTLQELGYAAEVLPKSIYEGQGSNTIHFWKTKKMGKAQHAKLREERAEVVVRLQALEKESPDAWWSAEYSELDQRRIKLDLLIEASIRWNK